MFECRSGSVVFYAKQFEKEFGIKCIQIHIHRDEGFNKTEADPLNIQLQQQVEQLTEKVTQLQADIERRKQQHEQDQKDTCLTLFH